jgi:hypothetical protein
MTETMKWRGQGVTETLMEKVWPKHYYQEDLERVSAALRSRRRRHPLRFFLDVAFDQAAKARWCRRSSKLAEITTFLGRSVVALARRF